MSDILYVVNGRICRIDLEKVWQWTPGPGVSFADDPDVAKHLAMFKQMKQEGYALLPPIDATGATSYLWFWEDSAGRYARLVLQRVIGEFDVNLLPHDAASQWTLTMYPQVKAAINADPYLKGAKILLYFGGQGGD